MVEMVSDSDLTDSVPYFLRLNCITGKLRIGKAVWMHYYT